MSEGSGQAPRIYLVGFMASGKTTVGRALAERLGSEFIDTDTLIEERTGLTVAALFAAQGEAEFRRIETQVLAGVSRREGVVVATGGGAVLDLGNQERLRSTGLVLWLRCPFAIIESRISRQGGTRPLALDAAGLGPLFTRREPLYAFAHHQIDASRAVHLVVDDVMALLGPRVPET